jgi:hypothetical protein
MQTSLKSGRGLIETQSQLLSGGTEENHYKSATIVGIVAELQKMKYPKKNFEFYRYTN